MKRNLITAFAFVLVLSASAAASADDAVVKDADKAVEAAGPAEYKIVPRDTLWDISGKFLKNPFKWPSIWKINPYIKNPHLIYPGDIVKITPDGIEIVSKKEAGAETLPIVTLEDAVAGPEGKVVVLEPGVDKAVVAEPVEALPAPPAVEAPSKPSVKSNNIQRRGFISAKDLIATGSIAAAKLDSNVYVSQGDYVYAAFKGPVKEGDRFAIFLEEADVKHPETGGRIGSIIDVLGELVVTGLKGEVAEARIEVSYKEIPTDAKLDAVRPVLTEVEITEAEKDLSGFVVFGADGTENLVSGDIAYVDKGERDGLKKGNLLRVYRPVEAVSDPNDGRDVNLPPIELGAAVVLEAGETTSSCIVIKSSQPINWGDRISTLRTN
ncbi:MAG: LysM peptidoglycan-binding domain-containing protein [Deltaproteobacteria bacterium]|nr:LysM peptidoglycan-binding domain-containing protein [Deltaproteobacteria bacterium]